MSKKDKPATVTVDKEKYASILAELRRTRDKCFRLSADLRFNRIRKLIDENNLYEAEKLKFSYADKKIRYYFQPDEEHELNLAGEEDGVIDSIFDRILSYHCFERSYSNANVLVRKFSLLRTVSNYIHFFGLALIVILIGIDLFTDIDFNIYHYSLPLTFVGFGFERQRLIRRELDKRDLKESAIQNALWAFLISFLLMVSAMHKEKLKEEIKELKEATHITLNPHTK